MAAELSVYNGGAWRTVSALYAYAGGAWRTITNAYRHDGTTWREFFASFTLTATTPGGFADANGFEPGNALATITTSTDGTVTGTGSAPVAYGSPTGGTNGAGKYWKWTYVSGDTPTAGTTTENTWTAVGSGVINMNRNSPAGVRQGTIALSFANDGSGTGATTPGNWTLTATVDI